MPDQESRIVSLSNNQIQGIERYAIDAGGMQELLENVLSSNLLNSAIDGDIRADYSRYMSLRINLEAVVTDLKAEKGVRVEPFKNEDNLIKGARLVGDGWMGKGNDWSHFRAVLRAIYIEDNGEGDLYGFVKNGGEIIFKACGIEKNDFIPDNVRKFPSTHS